MARHILHVIPSLSPGGAERQLVELAIYFKKQGEEVSVTYFGGSDFLKQSLENEGIRVLCFGLANNRSWIKAAFRIRNLVKILKPDLLHVWLFDAIFSSRLASLLSFSFPKIVVSLQCPDYSPDAIRYAGWPNWKVQILRVLDLVSHRISREVVVPCSNYLKAETSAHLKVAEESQEVILNSYRELKKSEKSIQKPDRKVLMTVGRLDPQKGHTFLIEALSKIGTQDFLLIIVGGGPLESSLKEQARRLGLESKIQFVGVQQNIADWLQIADLFIFPSLFEGFGIALLEAMGAGLPVIASDNGPIPEITTNECGLLVPTADSSALAKAIDRLLEDDALRLSMGKRAKLRAETEFSLEKKIGPQWQKLYTKATLQPTLGT